MWNSRLESNAFSKILSVLAACQTFWVPEEFFNLEKYIFPLYNVWDGKAGFGRTNQEGYFLSKTG